MAALLAGCAGLRPGPEAGARPPREALPLPQATIALAEATLTRAGLDPGIRHKLVIDPLIDRATGVETAATRRMEADIASLIRTRHPELELLPFTTASLDEQPLILLGAITVVQEAGSLRNAAAGPPAAYRIWAVLADLRTGRVLSHETAWARPDGVDATPATFFRDSPAWTADGAAAAYLRTCALDPGDPIDPAYLRSIRTQALVADGIRAYEGGRHQTALGFYAAAREGAAPDQQLRIRNGLYLANWALGRRGAAEDAFGQLVDYGLERERLAVKFVFRPGSTGFWPDPVLTRPYPMWLRQIATRTAARPVCLRVEGHTSTTGSAEVNDRLSQARAEAIRGRLLSRSPVLRPRLSAEGLGSRQTLVGTGADDASDLLDRRVEFEPRACPVQQAAADAAR